jgi:uncharacterized membrane protein
MGNLFVLAFKDENGAEATLKEVLALQKQELISVDDAATVVHHENGKVKVKQAKSLTGAAAVGGAFWGFLFGLIFFVPVAGLAIGATAGALMGKLGDYGIDDEFIKEASAKLTPGTSALFLISHNAQPEKVIAAIKPFGGELMQSSLSPREEKKLKQAMAT